jgi:hypothetical protein
MNANQNMMIAGSNKKTPNEIWDNLRSILRTEKGPGIAIDFKVPCDAVWCSDNLRFNYFYRNNGHVTLDVQAKKAVWEAYIRFHESPSSNARTERLTSRDEETDENGNYADGPEIFYSDCEMNFVDLPHAEYYIKETQILIDISKGLSMEKYLVMQ